MVEVFEKMSRRKFLVGKVFKSGRNDSGRRVFRGRSGGHKRRYVFIDYKREIKGLEGRVIDFMYDSNRNSSMMRVIYSNGMVVSVVRPEGIKVGDYVRNEGYGLKSELRVGDVIYCSSVKKGMFVYGVEYGKFCRSGGSYGQVIRVVGDRVLLKISSGRVILMSRGSGMSVGKVYFDGYEGMGKAGRSRWLGRSSKVRGVAMNPVDHPHGGATSGGRCSVSSKGLLSKCGGNRVRKVGMKIDKNYEE